MYCIHCGGTIKYIIKPSGLFLASTGEIAYDIIAQCSKHKHHWCEESVFPMSKIEAEERLAKKDKKC